jgi:ankyrin repeat protein
VATMRRLVAAGVDLNELDSMAGMTALHVAAVNGEMEALRLLVQAGAEKDALAFDGATPLQLCGYGGARGGD